MGVVVCKTIIIIFAILVIDHIAISLIAANKQVKMAQVEVKENAKDDSQELH